MSINIPEWASELKRSFTSGASSQFILYGNIFDYVSFQSENTQKFYALNDFLKNVMLENYDVIICYDRGRGLRILKADNSNWINLDKASSAIMEQLPQNNNFLPNQALSLIDQQILRVLNLENIKNKESTGSKCKLAVIIDFAQFIVPSGDTVQFANDLGANVIKILSWANDPSILNSNIATFLVTEKLNDLNGMLVQNPHSLKIEIKLPNEEEIKDYILFLKNTNFSNLEQESEIPFEILPKRFVGLSRTQVKSIISYSIGNKIKITDDLIKKRKKEAIEKECNDLLEFSDSNFSLDFVAGHDAVKKWLRDDASLLKKGKINALPMGYLISGRIGTGKTFLVQCWAGELGIPCVVLKNFRDKWMGTTEGNLEKIFSILKAIGQVVVFIDEADQMAGKRDSSSNDGGLSGRVYAMLAKEMSNTKNRGKIIWVFATSRPDLLEVDLKRQGRLDVHIPLFSPQTKDEYKKLLLSVAKKMNFSITENDLPELPDEGTFGGNEIEGILVRAIRTFELSDDPSIEFKTILKQIILEITPNSYVKKLEYMDLIAVKECTDKKFLPPKFNNLDINELDQKIDDLRRYV